MNTVQKWLLAACIICIGGLGLAAQSGVPAQVQVVQGYSPVYVLSVDLQGLDATLPELAKANYQILAVAPFPVPNSNNNTFYYHIYYRGQ